MGLARAALLRRQRRQKAREGKGSIGASVDSQPLELLSVLNRIEWIWSNGACKTVNPSGWRELPPCECVMRRPNRFVVFGADGVGFRSAFEPVRALLVRFFEPVAAREIDNAVTQLVWLGR